ncbi:MAG: PQQ-dependent sugar dehydrogenase [Blastocatellia bacterium]
MFSHAPAKLLLSFFFGFFLLVVSSTSFAQTFADPGFAIEVVTTLLKVQPGLTFAPDGRMFIWQENGIRRIFKITRCCRRRFWTFRRVNTVNDRGLLLALDPNFATNGYVYLYYTYEPNGNPERYIA